MKILYLTYLDFSKKDSLGVKRKILEQVESMNKLGNEVHYTMTKSGNLISNLGHNIYKFNNKIDRIINKYNYNIVKFILDNKFNIIYIRYTIIDIFFIKFIKIMKKNNIKVYLEIPTYPYDNEISRFKRIIDKIFRNLIKFGELSGIIISSDKSVKRLYNTEVIFIDNCIDYKKFKYKKREFKSNKINVIAVSFIRKSNGYDRFINGLYEYKRKNKKCPIKLHIVGAGDELNNLKSMVNKFDLYNNVIFHGVKTGNELEQVYDLADIAIGSIGDHRVGILKKSPLKVREYCARGIPFISSNDDCGFSNNEKFIIKVHANDSYIDMDLIISRYYQFRNTDISSIMRRYCENNFNWIKYYSKINDFNKEGRIYE